MQPTREAVAGSGTVGCANNHVYNRWLVIYREQDAMIPAGRLKVVEVKIRD